MKALKNKNWLLVGVTIMLVLLLVACGVEDVPDPKTNNAEATGEAAEAGVTKEFTINAGPDNFDQNKIRVKQGDKVKITLINDSGSHGLQIEDLGVKMVGGETTEFVADKKGIFVFACSVQCGADHNNMTGKLIVD